MRLLRFIGYFSQLESLIGFKATCVFTLQHILNKINPPRDGQLAHVQIGPYVCHFPSTAFFEGQFTEIFFKETYYLEPTREQIQAIDCGANIGVSLIYIKTRAPNARVICFEPNPSARKVLEENVEANGWGKDVHIFPFALGNKKGVVDFFVENKESTSTSGSVAEHHKNKGSKLNSYTVSVDVLSHYINRNIDFLKIDIEGAEFDVIEELASQNKLAMISAIQLEYHHIPGFSTHPISQMLSVLEANGFNTFVESNTLPHNVIGHDTWHTYMLFAWRNSPTR